MQLILFVLNLLQVAVVMAQTKSVSNTSVSIARPGLLSNGTKTLDYCRKSPDCLLVMEWLTFCNDTEIDPKSKVDSDAFRVCLCDPWSYYISSFKLFNFTWFSCLRCFVDNFAQDENIIYKSQLEYRKFCDLRTSNASWFLDFKWLVLIAGVPQWAYWSRPANEPTKYPWNASNYKLTISVGLSRTTSTLTTTTAPTSGRRTSKTSTAGETAAPSASPTAHITAPETSTASAAAATSKSGAAQRVVVLDLWTSLLLWLGPSLILLATVGGMVWL